MIVVTTPTGTIGHQVLQRLLATGERVRVIARDPSRLAPDIRERIEIVQGSHGDIDVVSRAFTGADTVFWLVPPDPHAERLHAAYVNFTQPACDALKAQGVRRVISVTALGRGTAVAGNAGLVTESLAMDDLIASGVEHGYLPRVSTLFRDRLPGLQRSHLRIRRGDRLARVRPAASASAA